MTVKSKSFAISLASLMLLATLITSIYFYYQQRQQAIDKASEQLTLLLDLRHSAIKRFFDTMQSEILFWSEDDSLRDSVLAILRGWRELGAGASKTLRQHYIENNPHPTGEKHKLDTVKDGSKYSLIHAAIQQRTQAFIKYRHYYDVFIIDPNGNVVYTYAKEDDYATNLNHAAWRDTGLARVYRAIRAEGSAKPKPVALVDFAPYVPSHGDLASFIAAPVKDKRGKLLAVIAFQVPIDRITDVMQFSEGMGETGETYLVGQDLLMRSNSRFSQMPTILRTLVDTVTVKRALKGEAGVQFTPDYRGIPVLSAYAPLQLIDIQWVIMSEIDQAEILHPVHDLRDRLIIAGIVIAVLMVIISIALTSLFRRT